MRFRDFARSGQFLLVATTFALTACGSNAPTAPKLELSEQEKKQVQELNEHRQKEWGGSAEPAVP